VAQAVVVLIVGAVENPVAVAVGVHRIDLGEAAVRVAGLLREAAGLAAVLLVPPVSGHAAAALIPVGEAVVVRVALVVGKEGGVRGAELDVVHVVEHRAGGRRHVLAALPAVAVLG